MNSRCDNFPVVVVAMYWSTLAFSLLGHALGRRWQEQKVTLSQERAPQEPETHAEEDPVVDQEDTAMASNADWSQQRTTAISDEASGLQQKRVAKSYFMTHSQNNNSTNPDIERIVAKRRVGSVDFFKVKYLNCPESCNAWVRKPKITRRVLSQFETKVDKQSNALALSMPYPYGSKPDWPPIYHTRFGRPVRPSWKVIDGFLTEGLLQRSHGKVKGPKLKRPDASKVIAPGCRRNIL